MSYYFAKTPDLIERAELVRARLQRVIESL
jgi:hypothetical protein